MQKLFTTAQIVRLSFALACWLLGTIIMMAVPTAGSHPAIVTGDGMGMEFWSLVFLLAAGILTGISVYRFARPKGWQRNNYPTPPRGPAPSMDPNWPAHEERRAS